MLVKNLESWVGSDCDYSIGEIIDLPDIVAFARIEAGVCEPFIETVPKPKRRTKDAEDIES